jgi:hypothetical protein
VKYSISTEHSAYISYLAPIFRQNKCPLHKQFEPHPQRTHSAPGGAPHSLGTSGILCDYRLDNRVSIPGRDKGIFLASVSRPPGLRSTQPPIQWVPGVLARGKARPERDADHSPPYSAEIIMSRRLQSGSGTALLLLFYIPQDVCTMYIGTLHEAWVFCIWSLQASRNGTVLRTVGVTLFQNFCYSAPIK